MYRFILAVAALALIAPAANAQCANGRCYRPQMQYRTPVSPNAPVAHLAAPAIQAPVYVAPAPQVYTYTYAAPVRYHAVRRHRRMFGLSSGCPCSCANCSCR